MPRTFTAPVTGFIPVMPTAFSSNGDVDYNGMDAMVDFFIKNGASGLFTVCLTSEMYHLTPEERLELVSRVVKRAQASGFKGPVLATGTFGGPVNLQADSVRRTAEAGANIVVLLPNQLAAETEDDALLSERIDALLSMTDDIPLGLYECPSPYHRLTTPELISTCGKSGRFYYIKETTGRPEEALAKVAAAKETSLSVFNAHQPSLLSFLQGGGEGVSPIGANVSPRLNSELCNCFESDPERAKGLQQAVVDVSEQIRHRYPLDLKWYMNKKGLPIEPFCRAVSNELTAADRDELDRETALIDRILDKYSVSNLV
jgi:4-hydroxy-tetrahydrodipicolinate synthase